MIVHNQVPKFVYLDPPKTGTRSVVYWLLDLFPAARKRGDHRREISEDFRRHAVFATVRNPYERAVSAWSKLIVENSVGHGHPALLTERYGDQSIESFLRWSIDGAAGRETSGRLFPLSSQSDFLAPAAAVVGGWDRIATVRLEDVPDAWIRLPFICRRMAARFPHRNRTEGRAAVADQSADFIRLVNDWAAPDFARFGYQRIDPSAWRTRSGGSTPNDAGPA